MSRTLLQKLIRQGDVTVNGKPTKPSYEPDPNDRVAVVIPPPEPYDLIPEPMALDVIYEDDYLLAINKPKGIIVHPSHGAQTGTLANGLAYYARTLSHGDDPFRPGIVHRLDKNTTGVMLVAKTDETHWRLSLQFDTAYLPSPPDYTKVQADLYVGGTLVGSTDNTGAFTAWTGDTGGSGTLVGAVVLSKDTAGTGAKVNLVVSAPADTCWPASGTLAQGVTYLKLDLASQFPTGCTETSPCLISAGADAPAVVGTLTVNSLPVPGATVIQLYCGAAVQFKVPPPELPTITDWGAVTAPPDWAP